MHNYKGFEAIHASFFTALDKLDTDIAKRTAAIIQSYNPVARPVEWPSYGMKPTLMNLSIWM